MMCQCRFINGNKCTTLVRDADNGGGYVCVGEGSIWEISVPSFQFCCKPKSALQKILFFFLFTTKPTAYGSFQATGPIRAVTAALCQSHGNN